MKLIDAMMRVDKSPENTSDAAPSDFDNVLGTEGEDWFKNLLFKFYYLRVK